MIKLSVCLIARNEGACLERCLRSIETIADEIVLVDTGSTDNTKAIAAQFDARIFDFAWSDDFSQARNYSLEQATGGWILVLDADETIAGRDLSHLQQIINSGAADAYSLVQRSYGDNLDHPAYINQGADSYPESQAFGGWIPSPLVRLFRNDPHYRFRYRVHELIEPSILEHQGVLAASSIPIHHFTYQKEAAFVEAKEKRYLTLALKQIADTPGNPKPYREAAQVYLKNGDNANAERCLRKGIDLDPGDPSRYLYLGGLYLACQRLNEGEDVLTRGLTIAPDNVAMMINLACVHLCKSQFDQAYALLQRALALAPDSAKVHNNLGFLHLATHRAEHAVRSFQSALKYSPRDIVALINLGVLYLDRKEFDQAQILLKRAHDLKPEDPKVLYYLAMASVELGRVGPALDLLHRAARHVKNNAAIEAKIRELEARSHTSKPA